MRRMILLVVLFSFAAAPMVWAEDQTDEPTPFEEQFSGMKETGVDVGIYFAAGKALNVYDFARLNNKLAPGGTDPFSGRIDDWNFEFDIVSTREFYVGLAGAFWNQETGGRYVGATLDGWNILARWGTAVVDNRLVQIFPSFGCGYARHMLTLDGDLTTLDLSNLPRRGDAEIMQEGLLLEAAIRIDMFSGVPENSQFAFLSAQGLTFGWQGVPIASDWEHDGDTVNGLPDAFNSAFFVRYTIGFGMGLRMTDTGDE